MIRAALAIFGLTLYACREPALEYPPPEQRPNFQGYHLAPARVLAMNDPDLEFHIVRDISPALIASWRWTDQHPAVRIRVRDKENLKYTIDFTLPEITFKDTGPVTIAFVVNSHELDRIRYSSSGFQHFEKRVPADWLENFKDAIVGAEIDKIWISKDDGARFGFILTRIGLMP